MVGIEAVGSALSAVAQSGSFPDVSQPYLLEARQMQAMSFAVHIPLVCFGIAFPAMVVFMEWLHRRTGDPVYRAIAKRWSHVMLILFAVGVITIGIPERRWARAESRSQP